MKKIKLSLKNKALLAIIFILLPILIAFFANYYKNRGYLRQRILDTLTVIAESYEGQVYQFLESAKRRAEDFASDGFIKSELLKKTHGKEPAFDALSNHLIKNKLSLDKTIMTIHVLSLDGRVTASTNPDDMGKDFSPEPFFIKGKDTLSVIECMVENGKTPEIAISAPIYRKGTERPLGVIVNFIQASELNKLLLGDYVKNLGAISSGKGKGAWATLEIYLVNKDKFMITQSIFVKDAIMKQIVDTLPVQVALTSNKEIAGFYKDYRGIDVVGASMYIPSLKWVLLVEIDTDEVILPIQYILKSVIITASVVVIMVFSLYVTFLRRVVKPLRAISLTARDVGEGRFDVVPPLRTADEIGILYDSFNYMVNQIKSRTTALAESKASLVEAQRIARLGNWEWDIVENETSWSDEVYHIFGLSPRELDVTYETFLNCVHPDDRELVKKSVHDALYEKKPYEIDHRILLRDGSLRFVHEKAEVAFDAHGKAIRMTGTVQDITERRRSEKEINLLQTMTIAIAEAPDFHSALRVALQKVCESTGWVYGEAWLPSSDGKYLKHVVSWYNPRECLEEFEKKSKEFVFSPGLGLPGRVLLSKKPEWKRDATSDGCFPRASIARKYGLKAALGIPVILNEEVIAILNFFVREQRDEDERLVKITSSVAAQLGAVIRRKQAEDALQDSEEKLRAIIDNTTAVVFVKDLQGRYLLINKQYEKIFHITRSEIINKTDYNLFPKELADKVTANDQKIVEVKAPLEFEEIITQDDGLHSYIAIKFPLLDSHGIMYAVCGIATDITERKQMEESLRESEERFRLIAETVAEVFWMADVNIEGILYVNPSYERVWGRTRKSLYENPRSFLDAIHLEDRKRVLANLELEKIGQPFDHEYRIIRPDGSIRWIWDRGFPVYEKTGQITRYVGVAQDITERKKIEEEKEKLREQLYHSQRLDAVGKLAGGIAHDFNNILTAIIGYGNLLQMEFKEDSQSKMFIQRILTSAERAARLTQGLLAFSRKQIGNPVPINLNETIKREEHLLARLIREDIKLKVELINKDCTVMADTRQIEQVLMNLVTNARDAMPNGGTLTIQTNILEVDKTFLRIHAHDTSKLVDLASFVSTDKFPEKEPKRWYVCMSVSDTGMGMDKQTQMRVFEPFFTTKEVGKGTGIGLAIVYGIIKQHNGYIDVESEPGEGTTFRIYLPFIGSKAEDQKPSSLTTPAGGNETILMADDEEEVRRLYKTVLENAGYTVIEAINGMDAINKFKLYRDKIRLLVLDVIMPEKNGKEAYDSIKELQPDMKAIFMSGYSENIVHKKGIIKEGIHYISKPSTPTDFLRKVREALDG